MKINSEDLYNIGKKLSFISENKECLVFIKYFSGKKEIYLYEKGDFDDPIHSIYLTEDELKQLALELLNVVEDNIMAEIPLETNSGELILIKIFPDGSNILEFYNGDNLDKLIKEIKLNSEESRDLANHLLEVKINPVSGDILERFKNKIDIRIIKLNENSTLVGKSIKESNVRVNTGLNILAIVRDKDDNMIVNPDAKEILYSGDQLIICGTKDQINKFNEGSR